jgi:competence protein ComEC
LESPQYLGPSTSFRKASPGLTEKAPVRIIRGYGAFPYVVVLYIIILMFHPSRIFAGLLFIFIVAVAYYSLDPINIPFMPQALIVVLGLLTFFWRQKPARYILLILLFVFLGIYRTSQVAPAQNQRWVQQYIGQEGNLTIRIIEEPRINGKSQQLTGRIEGLRGNIQISTNQFPAYHFGDTLVISGKITDLSEDSEQYRGYFKTQGIYAFSRYPQIRYGLSSDWYFRLRKPLLNLRLKYEDTFGKILPEPQAGLLSGIILGSKASLSEELLGWLSVTGTIHIIALSGFNITIVAEFMRILARNLSARLSFYLPVIGIILFVLATGLSSSVIRAAIMGIVLLLARRVGRQSDALVSVLFASSVMIYANPSILLYDVGFQLSFAAVCGILFLAPRLERYFSFLGKTVGPVFSATLSAQVFSIPITSYYFGLVSVISPIANILIIPFIPAVMLLGFIAASLGMVSLWLGRVIGFISWVLLTYFLKVIEYLSSVSFASRSYKVTSIYFIIGYYLILFDIVMMLGNRRRNGKSKTV